MPGRRRACLANARTLPMPVQTPLAQLCASAAQDADPSVEAFAFSLQPHVAGSGQASFSRITCTDEQIGGRRTADDSNGCEWLHNSTAEFVVENTHSKFLKTRNSRYAIPPAPNNLADNRRGVDLVIGRQEYTLGLANGYQTTPRSPSKWHPLKTAQQRSTQ